MCLWKGPLMSQNWNMLWDAISQIIIYINEDPVRCEIRYVYVPLLQEKLTSAWYLLLCNRINQISTLVGEIAIHYPFNILYYHSRVIQLRLLSLLFTLILIVYCIPTSHVSVNLMLITIYKLDVSTYECCWPTWFNISCKYAFNNQWIVIANND